MVFFDLKIGDLVAGELRSEEGSGMFPTEGQSLGWQYRRKHIPVLSITSEDPMSQHRVKSTSTLWAYLEVIELGGKQSLDVSRFDGHYVVGAEQVLHPIVTAHLSMNGLEDIWHCLRLVAISNLLDQVDTERPFVLTSDTWLAAPISSETIVTAVSDDFVHDIVGRQGEEAKAKQDGIHLSATVEAVKCEAGW